MLYLIVAIGLGLMALERLVPATRLPAVKGWWVRVAVINTLQLGVVLLGGVTWDRWLQRASVFDLPGAVGELPAAAIAYLILTFVFYWWHRARHEVSALWVGLHQVHHSASRIETITSFFKHPLEILCNSLIIGAIVFAILGLSPHAAAVVTLFCALAEFFYHMNIKTPHWVGYFLQRPEMHRLHHQHGVHYRNFADLPLWDRMFGTYENPKDGVPVVACGFKPEQEARLGAMLRLVDVNPPQGATPRAAGVKANARRLGIAALLVLGSLNMAGWMAGSTPARGLGLMSAAAPLPLVFSDFRGIEPFAQDFHVEAETQDGRTLKLAITPEVYARLDGPYNRRNAYGAVFAAGPKMESPAEQALWTSVMTYGFCGAAAPLATRFGLEGGLRRVHVTNVQKTAHVAGVATTKTVECPQ